MSRVNSPRSIKSTLFGTACSLMIIANIQTALGIPSWVWHLQQLFPAPEPSGVTLAIRDDGIVIVYNAGQQFVARLPE